MLWRRGQTEGRRPFLAPRPVPQRIAGYEPAPPVETGRVPHHEEAAKTPVPEAVPEPAYPPRDPVHYPEWFLNPPPFPEPPIVIPPGPPPCDPEEDPECEEEPEEPPKEPPEEPPTDVPEPGTLAILAISGFVYWLARRRRKQA